jgi:hypothetical protein
MQRLTAQRLLGSLQQRRGTISALVRWTGSQVTDRAIHSAAIVAVLQACAASEQDMHSTSDRDANTAAPALPDGRKAHIGLYGDGAIGVLDLDSQRMVKTVPRR